MHTWESDVSGLVLHPAAPAAFLTSRNGPAPWSALTQWLRRARPAQPLCTELRIDVQLPLVEGELEALHERLHTPGSKLWGIDSLPLPTPGRNAGLVMRQRIADGNCFIYVEDRVRGCLAGYTMFQRMCEVDRHAGRWIRSPHSRFAPAYQRRGIASAVYRHMLQQGTLLVSGARQSPAAHGLWEHLARSHGQGYLRLADKRLHYLGQQVDSATLDQLETRRMLLPTGWPLERLAEAVRMQGLP